MPPLSTYNLNRNNNGPSSPGGPLDDTSYPQTPGGANGTGTNGETPSPARARTPSVTRSLSRRESIVANQGLGGMMSHFDLPGGNSYQSGGGYSPGLGSPLAGFGNVGHGPASGDRGGGFSKLTLVRAPSKGKNAGGAGAGAKKGEDANGGGSGASTPGRRSVLIRFRACSGFRFWRRKVQELMKIVFTLLTGGPSRPATSRRSRSPLRP